MTAEFRRALFRGFLIGVVIVVLFYLVRPVFAQEYYMSEDEAYAAQTMLFEMGYTKVGFPDGKVGPKTREAISQLQENNDWPVTGYLTESQYLGLMQVTPNPRKWGAISASTDAGYGSTWNYSSGIEAYTAARDRCWSNSYDPSDCITLVTFAIEDFLGWIAAVKCDQVDGATDRDHIFLASRPSRGLALEAAFESADTEGFYRSNCYLREVIAADGSHQ